MNIPEIEKCPHCGSPAETVVVTINDEMGEQTPGIGCTECSALMLDASKAFQTYGKEHEWDYSDALEDWNRRQPTPEAALICPFCSDFDFDDVGLKHHLLHGHCESFNKVERHPGYLHLSKLPQEVSEPKWHRPDDNDYNVNDFTFAGLDRVTATYVGRFARALGMKLLGAKEKYGYTDGWASPHWEDECQAKFMEHIAKGDPLDVAAFCMFMWKHQWSTAHPPKPEPTDAHTECLCPQHGRWLAADDIYRMVRELDVEMNGLNGAAKQASLCDIFQELKDYIEAAKADVVIAPKVPEGVPFHELEHLCKWAWDADNRQMVVSRDVLEGLISKYRAAAPKEIK